MNTYVVLQKRCLSDARLSPNDQCLAVVVQAIEDSIQALHSESPSDLVKTQ